MSWIERAACLPGKAWHLATALWFVAIRDRKKPAQVTITLKTLRRFGLTRKSYYRAQGALASVKLIRVTRRRGCKPLFTILPVAGMRRKKRHP